MNMLILNRKRLLDLLVLEHFLFPNPSIGKSKELPNIARPPAGGGVAHTDGDSAPPWQVLQAFGWRSGYWRNLLKKLELQV